MSIDDDKPLIKTTFEESEMYQIINQNLPLNTSSQASTLGSSFKSKTQPKKDRIIKIFDKRGKERLVWRRKPKLDQS